VVGSGEPTTALRRVANFETLPVRTLPYWIVPIVLVVWLTARLFYTPATVRSRWVITGLAALSILGFVFWPGPGIAVTLFQTAVCLTIVFYSLVRPAFAPTPGDSWPKF
jgi:hypothetical protein